MENVSIPANGPQFGDFPKPLAGEPFGYLFNGKLQGCTREELIRRCAGRNFRQVQLVWTPDYPELVPVAEVPFLFEAALSALRFRLKISLLVGVILTLILGLAAKQIWLEERSYALLMLVALVLLGIAPSFRSLRTLRELSGITPEGFDHSLHVSRSALWVASQNTIGTKLLAGGMIFVGLLQLRVGMEQSIFAAALIKDPVRAGRTIQAFQLCLAPWWSVALRLQLYGIVEHRTHGRGTRQSRSCTHCFRGGRIDGKPVQFLADARGYLGGRFRRDPGIDWISRGSRTTAPRTPSIRLCAVHLD